MALISALPTYIVSYLLGFFGLNIFVNSWGFGLNILLLMISTLAFVIITSTLAMSKTGLIFVVLFQLILAHFANSATIAFLRPRLEGDAFGLSWIIVLPLSAVYLLVTACLVGKKREKRML
jgi:hypothetical protein